MKKIKKVILIISIILLIIVIAPELYSTIRYNLAESTYIKRNSYIDIWRDKSFNIDIELYSR